MREQGKRGEQIAAQYLTGKGYHVVAQNFFTRGGEIDIIAGVEGYIVFCEVKMRKNDTYGMPQEFVSPTKQRKIRRCAEEWLMQNPGCRRQPRFDVIAILSPDGGLQSARVEHIENAF